MLGAIVEVYIYLGITLGISPQTKNRSFIALHPGLKAFMQFPFESCACHLWELVYFFQGVYVCNFFQGIYVRHFHSFLVPECEVSLNILWIRSYYITLNNITDLVSNAEFLVPTSIQP